VNRKSCRVIRRLLPLWDDFEPSSAEHRGIEMHLRTCPHCRKEYELLRWVAAGSALLKRETENAVQAVDWTRVPAMIARRFPPRSEALFPKIVRFFSGWRTAVLVLFTLTVAAGVLIWVAFFRPGRRAGSDVFLSADSISRIERTVGREGILDYLNQSQMLLTGLMENCNDGDGDPRGGDAQIRKARDLLQREKYCAPDFQQIELAKAKPLCDQIGLLFFEMTQLNPQDRCADISRIQERVRSEKMLFKIRLLEKDLSGGREV
jgi:hypothetical protein